MKQGKFLENVGGEAHPTRLYEIIPCVCTCVYVVMHRPRIHQMCAHNTIQ